MSLSGNLRVGVDWGSSTFRAYQFDAAGNVKDSIQSAQGLKQLEPNEFESTLFAHIGNWVKPGDTVVLCGMVTSRTGWVETPYLECPAKPAANRSQLIEREVRGVTLLFMPGLCQLHPNADVMRGEELQLLGAHALALKASPNTPLESNNTSAIILPGTHSKWALTNNATILSFKTIPTGELFEAVVKHTLLGAFADDTTWEDTVFTQGVKAGAHSATPLSDLFSVRASVLLEQKQASEVYAYLSGFLIGNEIKEGQAFCFDFMQHAITHFCLIGSHKLCKLYKLAMHTLDVRVSAEYTDASQAGFTHIAQKLK